MTAAELEKLREEGARDLIARRRKAVDDAVDLALYDAQREARDAWALADRRKTEIEKLQGECARLAQQIVAKNRDHSEALVEAMRLRDESDQFRLAVIAGCAALSDSSAHGAHEARRILREALDAKQTPANDSESTQQADTSSAKGPNE